MNYKFKQIWNDGVVVRDKFYPFINTQKDTSFLGGKFKDVVDSLYHYDDHLELIVDIESCHNEMRTYSCKKQWVGPDQIIRERNIISIQFASRKGRKVSNVNILNWDYRGWEDRDYWILKNFTDMCSKFKHLTIYSKNGARFDIPYITGRLAWHGLPSLPPFRHVDIEAECRKIMYLNSYRLDYLNKYFGGTGKIKMEREDWFAAEEGSIEALKKFNRYGAKDVKDTGDLINHIEPYCPAVRPYSLIKINGGMCPFCLKEGKKFVMEKRGFKRIPSGYRQIWHCKNPKHPYEKPTWITDPRVLRDY